MGKIFDPDNVVFSSLSKIVDIVFLSILWAVFCIPIFTIGAATSALYYTSTKTIRHNRDYVWRSFWGGFKSSFKVVTPLWIGYALFMLLLYADITLIGNLFQPGTAFYAFTAIFIATIVVASLWILYVLPYTARFDLNRKGVAKNCLMLAIRHLPSSVLLVIITVLIMFAAYIFTPLILILPALWGFLASLILERVFKKYMTEEDREIEDEKNNMRPTEYSRNKED